MNLSIKKFTVVLPMVVTDGDPFPKRLLADIDMSISPSPTFSEQGLRRGTLHIPCLHDKAEMVKESHISPVLESVYEIV